jgi:hypothetical protein
MLSRCTREDTHPIFDGVFEMLNGMRWARYFGVRQLLWR